MDQKRIFRVSGMTCGHCESRVSRAARAVPGVTSAIASFSKNRLEVTYNSDVTNEEALVSAVSKAVTAAGYRVAGLEKSAQPISKVIPVAILLLALYMLLRYTIGFDFFGYIPKIDSTISLSALFITGLFTSVHCIAMCGGINLSQSVGAGESAKPNLKKPLLYNLGRVISYTVIGGLVGGVGSVLFLSEPVKAILLALAAVGMLLMGLSMLGWLPWWLTPRIPRFLAKPLGKAGLGKGPLVVGLLNGFMPCGPLQAMQLYALATGSVLNGALSMFLFSLGTVPLMLGAGTLFSVLKGKFAYVVQRVSAVLVVFFAVVMATNALSLAGLRPSSDSLEAAPAATAAVEEKSNSLLQQALDKGYIPAVLDGDVQKIQANLNPSVYPFIIVQKGIPVELTITADENAITGCNQTVVFPAFDVRKALTPGDNVIKFIPSETGLLSYTCWMGMLNGRILVVDDLFSSTASVVPPTVTTTPTLEPTAPNLDSTTNYGSCCG